MRWRRCACRLPTMTIGSRIAGHLRRLFSSDARRSEVGPTILLYHRIGVDRFDPWAMTISADNFAAQMEWLAKHRSVVPLVDFAAAHRRNALPADAVAITFDDGNRDRTCAAARRGRAYPGQKQPTPRRSPRPSSDRNWTGAPRSSLPAEGSEPLRASILENKARALAGHGLADKAVVG